MFRTRAIAALILTPFAALTIYFGGWFYFAIISTVLMIGIVEFVNLMNVNQLAVPRYLLMGGVLLYLVTVMELPYLQPDIISAAFFFLSLLYVIFLYERTGGGKVTQTWMAMIAGFVIFGWIGRHILMVRTLENGLQWTFMVVAIIWMSDTMAYLVGSRIGRRQITPNLSPKKSLEGYLSGIFLGTAGAALFRLLFLPDIPWDDFLIFSIILTPIVPAGDLGFSLLKREAGLKDTSQLIPGHGGILDRFDTIIWGMMIAYYLLLYLV